MKFMGIGMNNEEKLKKSLSEYILFLSSSKAPGAEHWANMLLDASTSSTNIGNVAEKILTFYGGMGSINDIVFEYGTKEQKKYEQLNGKVYSICKVILRERS